MQLSPLKDKQRKKYVSSSLHALRVVFKCRKHVEESSYVYLLNQIFESVSNLFAKNISKG